MLNFEIEEMNINADAHIAKIRDPTFWMYAATEWHRLYREYVPFSEGALYNSVSIQGGDGNGTIEHTAPYAHYMYEGLVMGPNVPIVQGGAVVGFFSPEKPKHYTGGVLHFTGMASRHWDEAAAPAKMPLLIQSIQGFADKMKF